MRNNKLQVGHVLLRFAVTTYLWMLRSCDRYGTCA